MNEEAYAKKMETRPEASEERIADSIQALANRPALLIRTKIVLSFCAFFLLCVILNGWNIYIMSEISSKIKFLEISDKFMAEIQQARRYEKNYLLYGTNLKDAKAHLGEA